MYHNLWRWERNKQPALASGLGNCDRAKLPTPKLRYYQSIRASTEGGKALRMAWRGYSAQTADPLQGISR